MAQSMKSPNGYPAIGKAERTQQSSGRSGSPHSRCLSYQRRTCMSVNFSASNQPQTTYFTQQFPHTKRGQKIQAKNGKEKGK